MTCSLGPAWVWYWALFAAVAVAAVSFIASLGAPTPYDLVGLGAALVLLAAAITVLLGGLRGAVEEYQRCQGGRCATTNFENATLAARVLLGLAASGVAAVLAGHLIPWVGRLLAASPRAATNTVFGSLLLSGGILIYIGVTLRQLEDCGRTGTRWDPITTGPVTPRAGIPAKEDPRKRR